MPPTETTALDRRTLSPAAMLLWEEWHQTRGMMIFFLIVFLLLAAWAPVTDMVATMLGTSSPVDDLVAEAGAMIGFWLGVAVAGVLIFSYYGRDDMRFTFPTRLFALPVRTETLVAVRMLYAALVVGVLYTILAFGMSVAFNRPINVHWIPFAAICAMAYLQAFSWMTGRFNSIVVLLVAVGLAVPAILGLYEIVQYLPGPLLLRETVVVANFLLLCYILAVFAVVMHRHGTVRYLFTLRRSSVTTRVAKAPSTILTTRARDTFDSADQAQLWFEQRRLKRVFAVSAAILLLPITAILVLESIYWFGGTPPMGFDFAGYWLIAAASIAGLFLVLLDDRDRRSGLQRFVMARPMSTRTLAVARLKGAAVSVLIGYAVVLDVSLMVSVATGDFPAHWIGLLAGSDSVPISLLLLVLHIVLTVVVAWTILLIAGPLLVLGIVMWLLTYLALGFGLLGVFLFGFPESAGWIYFGICAALAVGAVALGVVRLFRHARSLGLLTTKDLKRSFIAWTGILAVAAAYVPISRPWSIEERLLLVPLSLLATILCVAPVAVVPYIFHLSRHR